MYQESLLNSFTIKISNNTSAWLSSQVTNYFQSRDLFDLFAHTKTANWGCNEPCVSFNISLVFVYICISISVAWFFSFVFRTLTFRKIIFWHKAVMFIEISNHICELQYKVWTPLWCLLCGPSFIFQIMFSEYINYAYGKYGSIRKIKGTVSYTGGAEGQVLTLGSLILTEPRELILINAVPIDLYRNITY